jgi:hypothetical protein
MGLLKKAVNEKRKPAGSGFLTAQLIARLNWKPRRLPAVAGYCLPVGRSQASRIDFFSSPNINDRNSLKSGQISFMLAQMFGQ